MTAGRNKVFLLPGGGASSGESRTQAAMRAAQSNAARVGGLQLGDGVHHPQERGCAERRLPGHVQSAYWPAASITVFSLVIWSATKAL